MVQKYTQEAIKAFNQSKAFNHVIFLNDILKWITMSNEDFDSSLKINETYANTAKLVEKNVCFYLI